MKGPHLGVVVPQGAQWGRDEIEESMLLRVSPISIIARGVKEPTNPTQYVNKNRNDDVLQSSLPELLFQKDFERIFDFQRLVLSVIDIQSEEEIGD